MKEHSVFSLLIFTILLNGCTTAKLWSGGIQGDYVKIVPKDPNEDVELTLKAKGREYYCKTFLYSSYKNNKVCYMKYSDAEKLKDLKIKLYKTPEKLLTDAGITIFAVGYIVVGGLFDSGYHSH